LLSTTGSSGQHAENAGALACLFRREGYQAANRLFPPVIGADNRRWGLGTTACFFEIIACCCASPRAVMFAQANKEANAKLLQF
jgi:hypothetical protein